MYKLYDIVHKISDHTNTKMEPKIITKPPLIVSILIINDIQYIKPEQKQEISHGQNKL